MKIDFWSNSRLGEFWDMVKLLLTGVSPGIMISVAVSAVGMLIIIVINAWKSSSKENNDERDYEYREY